MDLEEIGYFLYMEQQERQQKQIKVNVEEELLFVEEQARSIDDQDSEKDFS